MRCTASTRISKNKFFLISLQNYPPCMPNTRRGRESLFPYDHELERTMRNMNRNLGINDEDPNQNIPAPADVHGQMLPNAPSEHK